MKENEEKEKRKIEENKNKIPFNIYNNNYKEKRL